MRDDWRNMKLLYGAPPAPSPARPRSKKSSGAPPVVVEPPPPEAADEELGVIAALAKLAPEVRARVLRYAVSKWGPVKP